MTVTPRSITTARWSCIGKCENPRCSKENVPVTRVSPWEAGRDSKSLARAWWLCPECFEKRESGRLLLP